MDEQDKIIIEVDDSELDAGTEARPSIRVLSFCLGTEHYCFDITEAKEVFKPSSITRVPNTPGFVVGVTNLHGQIVPLVDIRYFLGLEQKEGLSGTKAITTDTRGSLIGLMVDDVDEARDIEESSIQPPLATIKGRLAEFTKGQVEMGKEILILIDLKRILNCEEIENLRKDKI
jgi:purine-binding chemotaxis protein CheW